MIDDLGPKIYELSRRTANIEFILGFMPIQFPPILSSNFYNQLLINTQRLTMRIVRLEKILGLVNTKSNLATGRCVLNNLGLKLTALCFRLSRIEHNI